MGRRGRERKKKRDQGRVAKGREGIKNWKEEEEEFDRWWRRKSVIWRGMDGRSEEEREEKLNRIVERVQERKKGTSNKG